MSSTPCRGCPHRIALVLAATVLMVWLAAMLWLAQAMAAQAPGTVLALFPPTLDGEQSFGAIARAGARPVRATGLPFVWVVYAEEPGVVARLKVEGALAILGSLPFLPSFGGCAALG